jgi:hypothetical protein
VCSFIDHTLTYGIDDGGTSGIEAYFYCEYTYSAVSH